MATDRAVDNNQIFLNPCVLADDLHQSLPLCDDVAQELTIYKQHPDHRIARKTIRAMH